MKITNLKALGSMIAVALVAPAIASAQNNLNGTWVAYHTISGVRCSLTMVINGDRYSEIAQGGPYKTWQAGTWAVQGNFLVRQVLDFEPKSRYVVDGRPLGYDYTCPNGQYRCPGWYGGPGGNYPLGPGGHYEANATPPGGSYYVTMTSANSMVWKDANFGGTINFQRVQ